MKTTLLCLAIATLPLTSLADTHTTSSKHAAQARTIIKTFGSQLKQQLQTAMKAGGPVKAIQVCQISAPAIAGELSSSNAWQVGRTALKLRNQANKPDDWEQQVLNRFEQQLGDGKSVTSMELSEVVEQDGQATFRYMKPIATGPVCLSCHGDNLADSTAQQLNTLYPSDEATGFKLGDIRGAFTLSLPLQ